ncbi:MAG TPA: tRNA (N6-isopentenyl adenosine(37)-C2)-methylthiotransferase MiaB [Phycisphaerae bacterium]|nr:tRNA (N6-isopentenyl adenosine(37)-C2)-methylthiotransferase MiaB [Phycisphaerae bacterium]
MKVYLETMGCQMNRLDSELVTGLLRAEGHEMTSDRRRADVVLYNTCSVRQHAEDKVYSRLGADGRRKSSHRPSLIIGVLGCMAQKEGRRLRRRCPQVDIVCAPGQLASLPELIAAAGAGSPAVAMDPSRRTRRSAAGEGDIESLDLWRDPQATESPFQAFVRVMRGCDKFCSFCVVPFVRGPEASRNPQHIAEEARRLVEAGRCEITLLGQTVNSYRWRAGELDVRFSDLLCRVAGIAGLRRLRFITSHPVDFGNDILEAMRDLDNVCPYIHCPAQSGSEAVLKRMNRRYTPAQYDDLVDRARQIVPGVVLAGDFIVGFPGETEADHAASAELIRRSGYKNSFIFKYSPRPGTPAARNFADDVPQAVKKRRNNELLAVQEEVGLAHHRAYVGRCVEVLVEGPSPRADKQPVAPAPGETQLVGRTRGDHIVVFDAPESLAGSYVDVEITDATSLTLIGAAKSRQ